MCGWIWPRPVDGCSVVLLRHQSPMRLAVFAVAELSAFATSTGLLAGILWFLWGGIFKRVRR